MKTTKILKIVLAGILFISTAGFVYLQQSTLVEQKKQLILGTWIEDGTPTTKIEFKANGKCFWYLDGEPTEEFTYTIGSEFSPSGLEHPYVKLIAVNGGIWEVGESIEFGINSLGDDKMTLETTKPKVSYTHYTKQ